MSRSSKGCAIRRLTKGPRERSGSRTARNDSPCSAAQPPCRHSLETFMNMPLESTELAFQFSLANGVETGVETHKVFNQAEPCIGHNAFTGDVALRELVERHAPWSIPHATALGALAGDEQVQD